MKKEITKVGILSLIKLYGAIYGVLGFIIGLFAALFATTGTLAGEDMLPFAAGGIAMVIIMPIFYAIVGVIAGALGGALYNLFAGWVGGVQIEMKDVTDIE